MTYNDTNATAQSRFLPLPFLLVSRDYVPDGHVSDGEGQARGELNSKDWYKKFVAFPSQYIILMSS